MQFKTNLTMKEKQAQTLYAHLKREERGVKFKNNRREVIKVDFVNKEVVGVMKRKKKKKEHSSLRQFLNEFFNAG